MDSKLQETKVTRGPWDTFPGQFDESIVSGSVDSVAVSFLDRDHGHFCVCFQVV